MGPNEVSQRLPFEVIPEPEVAFELLSSKVPVDDLIEEANYRLNVLMNSIDKLERSFTDRGLSQSMAKWIAHEAHLRTVGRI